MKRRTRRFAVAPRSGLRPDASTVATLGLRARLILSPAERDRELADLIAAHARLQREWEVLFQRLVGLLETPNRSPD
jgi:hypothetical protein